MAQKTFVVVNKSCVCGGVRVIQTKRPFFMIMVNDNVFFEHVTSKGSLNMSLPLLYQQ